MKAENVPEMSPVGKLSIVVILIALACLAAVGLLSICQTCSERMPPTVVSEKVSRHEHHGTEASWKYQGVWYFTRDEKDFSNKERWLKI